MGFLKSQLIDQNKKKLTNKQTNDPEMAVLFKVTKI